MRVAWSLNAILSSNCNNKTCQKRATTSTEFALHTNTCIKGDYIGITMPGTNNDLTFYVCSDLLEYCSRKSTYMLVVVGDTEIMDE